MKLYVGNLPFSATDSEIRSLFEQHGTVTDLHIPLDRETGRPRGFAFITLSSRAEGEAARDELDGQDFGGRSLRISEAQERQPRGGGGGGGGDRRGGGGHRGGGGGRDWGDDGPRRGGGGGGGRDRDRDRRNKRRNRDQDFF